MSSLSAYHYDTLYLVYSWQTFEHVSEEDGDVVLREVMRVLRPGGHLALDTPNGRATRMQQPDLIDPDHEVEYDEATLTDKIRSAGFEILAARSLNHLGACLETGRSEEHTSELQSLMRISYAVLRSKKKKK